MARLREVLREEELVALRDCMGGYLPYSAGVHGFLDVTLKCQVLPFGDSKVYIPEGSQSSTLVVVAPSCSQTYIQNITVFWDTEKEDDENVIRLLKTVPGWDWTAPVYYRVTPLSVFAKLQTYLKNERLGNGGMWCQMVIKGPLFTIEDSDIRQMKIPEGFSLDSLRPEDAPAVISPWHYSWTESHQGVELLLARLPSVAIRQGSESASKAPVGGRLVSWCSLHNLCFLGNAFTVPGHRRKGLGTAVALAMVQKLRQKGIPVRSIVERSNTASVRFHESLGFKEQCDMVLFIMLPRGKALEEFIPKKTVQSEVKTGRTSHHFHERLPPETPREAGAMARLRQVSDRTDLGPLRDKMTHYLPQSAGVRGFLDVLIMVQQKLETEVYIPESSGVSSLIVVTPSCSQEYIQSLTLFWDTEEEDDEEVVHLLKTLPGWDWTAPVYFRIHSVAIYTKVQELMKKGSLGSHQMWSHKVFDGSLYNLDISSLQQFKLPEGFYLDSLHVQDGPTVASDWEYNWTETRKGLESIMANQPSVAIRKEVEKEGVSDASDGSRLVAWSWLYRHGFQGNTFTVPEFRRRGLGTAATLALAEKLRQLGIVVRIMVNHANTASISYHQSLGFERQCDLISFIMLPDGKTLQDYIK